MVSAGTSRKPILAEGDEPSLWHRRGKNSIRGGCVERLQEGARTGACRCLRTARRSGSARQTWAAREARWPWEKPAPAAVDELIHGEPMALEALFRAARADEATMAAGRASGRNSE